MTTPLEAQHPTPDKPRRTLTKGQTKILVGAAVPMVGIGGVGAWGTATNMMANFPDAGTAFGVVAAGEGVTFVLSLVYVGLILLGQAAPTAVRVGLWVLPAVAAAVGAVVAKNTTDSVVYAVTPMAMCMSAEGLGLLARRIVVYATGEDKEAERRNAETLQKLQYQWHVSQNHPDEKQRRAAELKAWDLLEKVGAGDVTLGTGLVTVQRERMTQGADAALAMMVGAPTVTAPAAVTGTAPALAESVTPALPAGRDARDGKDEPVTPVETADDAVAGPERDGTGDDTQVNDGDDATDEDAELARHKRRLYVKVAEIAVKTGVATPEPDEQLTDEQITVVLRALRSLEHPPPSYRQASIVYRQAGFKGAEEKTRPIWKALQTEAEAEKETKTDQHDRAAQDDQAAI
ncbi:hypothetical protein ACTWJ8_40285 (plasmid) [Streptomyces sp. SDT5-1]|uniref:hypothetical protein n=1 Tax=Streptomyces sp. SDT5-1 TaxID=3406418 RepID=UPI003FD3D989